MGKNKLHIPGLPPIPVVSDAEAEQADYLLCAPANFPTPFKDNFTGFCSQCDTKVQYRWHAPRKPKLLCISCFAKQS